VLVLSWWASVPASCVSAVAVVAASSVVYTSGVSAIVYGLWRATASRVIVASALAAWVSTDPLPGLCPLVFVASWPSFTVVFTTRSKKIGLTEWGVAA
jgi:hypothetical protein